MPSKDKCRRGTIKSPQKPRPKFRSVNMAVVESKRKGYERMTKKRGVLIADDDPKLHTHFYMEKELGVNSHHVIIDKDAYWLAVKAIQERQRQQGLERGKT